MTTIKQTPRQKQLAYGRYVKDVMESAKNSGMTVRLDRYLKQYVVWGVGGTDSGIWFVPTKLSNTAVNTLDSIQRDIAFRAMSAKQKKEVIRARALAKLTEEEIEALGL